jgi:glycosyltransferase involved in cell wall biosynthesis
MINDNNLVVIIPTYNNCQTLKEIILKCKEQCNNIIVVNDGSTDITQSVIDSVQGIETIIFEQNKGKGAALKAGFRLAIERGFEYAITIDSDGQHYPREISKFIKASEDEPNTLFVGSRNLSADNMPEKSSFANKFSNFWFKAETGITLKDTQSGFRLYPLHPFKKMKYISGRYEFELEVIVRAAWKGILVKNLEIQVYYPPKSERISHFRPFKDFGRISLLNTLFVFIALLWYWPFSFVKWFSKENIKNFIRQNITHSKESNIKIASAIGLGLFFGIVPLWGYQMVTAVIAAHFLKLNKLLVLVSSNISIPPMIPFILYGSFATGAFVFDVPLSIVPSDLTMASIGDSLTIYLTGSMILATVCGLAGMIISYLLLLIFRKPVK